ncbi:crossover junction endonuclease EME1-like [Paramacrobiotus metropolitanus]|uniref:crossover junction endonuclease EME1-like n=1 Tax=Paramacrobiotus metropolitanus TaxID=2943436 RepID=UPI0024464D6B|nr:crossover junction endonuclease EME1-like [Paramacrobiotus metropolitanus]
MGDCSDSDIECISDTYRIPEPVSCPDVLLAGSSGDSSSSVVLLSDSPFRPLSVPSRSSSADRLPVSKNARGDPSDVETEEPWMELFGSTEQRTGRRNLSLLATPNPADVAIAFDDDFDPEILFFDPSSPLKETAAKQALILPTNENCLQFSDNCGLDSALISPEKDKTTKTGTKPTLDEIKKRLSGKKPKIKSTRVDLEVRIGEENNDISPVTAPKKITKKRKETDDDFARRQEELAEKRRKKEEEKAVKQAAKDEREKIRKEKKLEKEASKLERKALKDACRPIQGGENSLKHVTAYIPTGIFEAFGRTELENLLKDECQCLRYEETDDFDTCEVIYWKREHITASVERSETSVAINKSVEHNQEKHVIIQVGKKNFVSMVDLYRQVNPSTDRRETLAAFVNKWKSKYPDYRLYFFVYGMEKYFRNQLNNLAHGDNRPARAKPIRKSIADIPYNITYDDVENAMMDLLCRFNLKIDQIETTKDFARYLITMHKAVSEFHFKAMKRQQTHLFDALSANTKTHGVTVTDDALDGYKELWIRQLQQFMLISRDVALAIANLYGSPRVLLSAYDACLTDKDRERLLENVIVRRGTERRIGPKMSRMICKYMCSNDGCEVLQ